MADTLPTLAAAPGFAFRMNDPVDSAFVRAVPASLSRLLFQRWAKDSATAYAECGEPQGDGYVTQEEWGVARITLLALEEESPDTAVAGPDSLWRHAGATLEVVRVLSLEGDPASRDYSGDWPSMEQLVVRPVVDTVTLDWDRRDDGWHRCGPVWRANTAIPIALVGPDAEARQEKGTTPKPVPAGASWAGARALADSIGRSGPVVVIRLSPRGPRHPAAASRPDSTP